jgi:hypothetical protein
VALFIEWLKVSKGFTPDYTLENGKKLSLMNDTDI